MPTNLKQVEFRIPRHPDAVFVDTVQTVAQQEGIGAPEIEFGLRIGGEHVKVGPQAIRENRLLGRAIELNGDTIERVELRYGQTKTVVSDTADAKDNLFRRVIIYPGPEEPRERFLEIVAATQNCLGMVNPRVAFKEYLEEDAQRYIQTRDLFLEQQAASLNNTINRLNDYVVELTDRYEERRKQLEAAVETKAADLEAKAEGRSQELAAREADIERKLKDVNDRESRYERRKTIQDLIDQLDSGNDKFKFELTSGTRKLRWPVIGGTVAFLLMVLAAAIYFHYRDLTATSDSRSEWSWIRPMLFSATFVVGTAIFLKWLSNWFHQHAVEEFRLKRTLLDVRRANLLIEAALEWEKDAKGEMPPELLDTLSRNLFGEGTAHDEHPPVDTLASAIFGQASQVKAKIGEYEFLLDRKALRHARRVLSNGKAE